MRVRRALGLLLATVGACTELPPDGPQVCSIEQRRAVPIVERMAIDLLIAIDRTPSMADQTARLRANLHAFAAVLASTEGGLPDLHVAVISTDLGGAGVPGCTARGDGGAFVGAAHCGIDGAFLRDDSDGTFNHAGDFAAALACLGELPLSSCPVSQPLAAIVAALDGTAPGNAGFRRPYAHLALLVISDSDDCSLLEPAALAGVTGEAAVDYTCYTLGAALADVDATLRYLRGIVDEPLQLFVSTITGGPDVRIGSGPSLEPVCADTIGPAPRLRRASLPDRTTHVDMCGENWADVFEQFPISPLWGEGPSACFDAIDRAPDVPGFQTECTGVLVRDADRAPVALVRSCSDLSLTPDEPCFRFVHDAERCPDSEAIAVLDYTPRSLPLGTTLEVRCAATCESS